MPKQSDFDDALKSIEKDFGAGSVIFMGSDPIQIEIIPTGCIALDLAVGGGYPKGRIVEVYGPESSGKTTLALHAIAEAQRQGGRCLFIDAEHAFDPKYAAAIGVDVSSLAFSQPNSGEEALEIAERLIATGELAIVVIDSVAALTPRAEIEGDMGDAHVGLQARLMGQAMRKLVGVVGRTQTICIFINQLREKVGVMFGSPETTPGGRALKFYSSVRLDVRRIESIKDGVEVVGNRTKVKVAKNKVAPPFRVAEFDIMYGEGISVEGSLIDMGLDFGFLKKSGAYITDVESGNHLGQGRKHAKQFLKDNEDYAVMLRDQILLKGGLA